MSKGNIEKADFQEQLHQSQTNASDQSTQDDILLSKELGTSVAKPTEPSEDEIDSLPRGRKGSRSSQSSNDSERTQPDEGNDYQTATPSRDLSRAQSSVRSVRQDPVKIPRNQRRGLLGRFTVIAEVKVQYDYPRRTKWMLTFVIAVAGSAGPMASSIILPALVDITRDFNSTASVVNLSVALFMLSMAIFPLWWSSFSETFGRRSIYLTAFTLYVIFSIVGAVSTNVGMFLASRVLSGGASASVQAVGAGSIADIWEVHERGRAIGIFYLGPLCGPLLSPIIGGLLAQNLGWRSIQWFLVIFGGIILLFLTFFLPETLRARTSVAAAAEAEVVEDDSAAEKGQVRPTLNRRTTTRSAVQVQSRKYIKILRRFFVDPLRIILYLQFPAVAICVFYATVTFCALYSLSVSIQQTFSAPPYNYGNIIVGLTYIPNSIGYFITSIFGGRWVDWIMRREAIKAGRKDSRGNLKYKPEDRMKENVWIGAIMFPAALILYGWTTEYGINLAVPLVANFFFGVGSMLIFAAVTTMLTEFMPKKASNGVALNNFVRNIFSCVGAAVTEPLESAIGNGWLFTGFGVISIVAGIFSILIMKRYGDRWRIAMDKNMDRGQYLLACSCTPAASPSTYRLRIC